MVNSQDVDFVDAHEPIDEAVRRVHDLADQRIVELWNGPARFWKWDQTVSG